MSDVKTDMIQPTNNPSIRFAEEPKILESNYYSIEHESDNDDVEMLMEAPPMSYMNRRPSVAAESFNPEENCDSDEDADKDQPEISPKTAEQRERLEKTAKNILLFRCLESNELDRVIRAMKEVHVTMGQKIISQDEEGDNFYVIEKGKFDIYVRDSQGNNNCVASYLDQGSFGELALMYNTPRAATIVVSSADGIIWSLDRATFRRIVLRRACKKRRDYEKLLKEFPLLSELSDYERANLADALHCVEFENEAEIFAQGEQGSEMYFVVSGEVRIVRQSILSTDQDRKELTRLSVGGYFGDLALITHEPRVASAYAIGHTKLAVLDRLAFERLMGPVLSIMLRNTETYLAKLVEIFHSEDEIPELLKLAKSLE